MDSSSILNHFAEKDLYRLILQSLEDGVYLVDTARRITYWNEGAERITGYLAQDIIGRDCFDNLLSHCSESGVCYCAAACPLSSTMADGRPRNVDAFLKHHLGYMVPVNTRTAPVRNSAGEIIGTAVIFHVDVRHYGLAQRFRGLEPFGCLDPETGVGNHEMTLRRMNHRLEELRVFGIPLGLLLIELPDYEDVLARCGQEAWRGLLQTTAQTVAQTMPRDGFLGRWESARFLALLGNCDLVKLDETANRLAGLVHASGIMWWGDSLQPVVLVRTTMAEPEDSPASISDRLTAPQPPSSSC